MGQGLSRRELLQAGGGLAVGAALGAGGAVAATRSGLVGGGAPSVPFDGPHEQPGIVGPRPQHLALAAFTLSGELRGAFGRQEVSDLLRDWSVAARRLTAGEALVDTPGPAGALGSPADTGEAAGLPAAGLTITIALGAGLFAPARDLVPAARRPSRLAPLPDFPREVLDPAWGGGELLVSAASDDAQVALHAVRSLGRIARGAAALRWVQRGFLPAGGRGTPRNLMGFKDGTAMLDHTDATVADRLLWAGGDEPAWLQGGGTYLVVRRIQMLLEAWDRSTLEKQEDTIGRTKAEGAPLGQQHEDDPVDLAQMRTAEEYAVPERSHVAIAHRLGETGATILRRPYSYSDGVDLTTGQLDAGLLFLAFQRSIDRQFVPLQAALARADALNEYVRTVGSAAFVVPPASRSSQDWVGRALFTR